MIQIPHINKDSDLVEIYKDLVRQAREQLPPPSDVVGLYYQIPLIQPPSLLVSKTMEYSEIDIRIIKFEKVIDTINNKIIWKLCE